MQIEQEVKDIISEECGVGPAHIQDDTRLADIQPDSLTIVEIMLQLEEKFGVDIPQSAERTFQTVKDVCVYIAGKIAEKEKTVPA